LRGSLLCSVPRERSLRSLFWGPPAWGLPGDCAGRCSAPFRGSFLCNLCFGVHSPGGFQELARFVALLRSAGAFFALSVLGSTRLGASRRLRGSVLCSVPREHPLKYRGRGPLAWGLPGPFAARCTAPFRGSFSCSLSGSSFGLSRAGVCSRFGGRHASWLVWIVPKKMP
jgi:hypothetical protein